LGFLVFLVFWDFNGFLGFIEVKLLFPQLDPIFTGAKNSSFNWNLELNRDIKVCCGWMREI